MKRTVPHLRIHLFRDAQYSRICEMTNTERFPCDGCLTTFGYFSLYDFPVNQLTELKLMVAESSDIVKSVDVCGIPIYTEYRWLPDEELMDKIASEIEIRVSQSEWNEVTTQ